MSKYDKLVEALNRLWQVQDTDLEDWVYGSQQAMHDAADAIESLQKELDAANHQLKMYSMCPFDDEEEGA